MLHVALRGFGPNSPQSMPNQLALKTMGEIMMNEMIQVEQHWHTVLNVEKLSASRVLKSAPILIKEKRAIEYEIKLINDNKCYIIVDI